MTRWHPKPQNGILNVPHCKQASRVHGLAGEAKRSIADPYRSEPLLRPQTNEKVAKELTGRITMGTKPINGRKQKKATD